VSEVEVVASKVVLRFKDGSTTTWTSETMPLSKYVSALELKAMAGTPRNHPAGCPARAQMVHKGERCVLESGHDATGQLHVDASGFWWTTVSTTELAAEIGVHP
tara:strand:- start:26758 stop:27069 length:312 start_codon:yes stop_codon:yes gene_type:complete